MMVFCYKCFKHEKWYQNPTVYVSVPGLNYLIETKTSPRSANKTLERLEGETEASLRMSTQCWPGSNSVLV